MIVMKFGGTSVQDGPAMRRAVEIIETEKDRHPLVVLSAIAGTTNALLRMGQTALSGDTRAAQEILSELVSRHRWILFDLGLGKPAERELADVIAHYAEELGNFTRGVVLLRELTPRVQDAMVGYGERLSVSLLTAAARAHGLEAVHVAAREVMLTDARFGKARPDLEKLGERCRDKIVSISEGGKIPIVEGFLGVTSEGEATTLGRGGSDFTA